MCILYTPSTFVEILIEKYGVHAPELRPDKRNADWVDANFEFPFYF